MKKFELPLETATTDLAQATAATLRHLREALRRPMKSTLSINATAALERAQRAYQKTTEETSTRGLNRAETRFYAATEALYHVLASEHPAADAAEQH